MIHHFKSSSPTIMQAPSKPTEAAYKASGRCAVRTTKQLSILSTHFSCMLRCNRNLLAIAGDSVKNRIHSLCKFLSEKEDPSLSTIN